MFRKIGGLPRTEQRIQKFLICPLPSHMLILSHYQFLHRMKRDTTEGPGLMQLASQTHSLHQGWQLLVLHLQSQQPEANWLRNLHKAQPWVAHSCHQSIKDHLHDTVLLWVLSTHMHMSNWQAPTMCKVLFHILEYMTSLHLCSRVSGMVSLCYAKGR